MRRTLSEAAAPLPHVRVLLHDLLARIPWKDQLAPGFVSRNASRPVLVVHLSTHASRSTEGRRQSGRRRPSLGRRVYWPNCAIPR